MTSCAMAVGLIAFCFFAAPADATMLNRMLRSSPNHGQQVQKSLVANSSSHLAPGLDAWNPSISFSAQPAADAVAPMMFVAVLTTRATPVAKRVAIRNLWREVDGGSGHICARFLVCKAADNLQQSLLAEHATHGDLVFLDCVEGYAQGLLTKKVIAAMSAYRHADSTMDACMNRPLFMKMDDDTFVAGHRFRTGFSAAVAHYGADYMYAGVDLPAQPPDRNASSPWYEPPEIWPHPNYVPAMYGGPGYILGRVLVSRIIDENIAVSNILWNEDRAVGVWVNALETRGAQVKWIRIPGTNGFSWDHPVKTGLWGVYPYTLHHHLSKACISCLTAIDKGNNPNALVDMCFLQEPLPGA